MDAGDAISPELVLVCPELRTAAAGPPAAVADAAPAPESAAPVSSAASFLPRLPDIPLAVGTVAAIAYAVAAFVH